VTALEERLFLINQAAIEKKIEKGLHNLNLVAEGGMTSITA
jgi:hypothetical protein